MEQIQHFSHEHPLIFRGEEIGDGEEIGEEISDGEEFGGDEEFGEEISDGEEIGDRKEILCDGCHQKVSGASYSCQSCSFFLHRFCAKLPVEMKHPMHPEHPLSLLSQPPYHYCQCDACGKLSDAFTYHCSLCKFDLDLVCASRVLSIVHESHEHPLIPQLNSASFDCYACGTKDEDVSYLCSTCGFWIHQDCASLPNTVKHSGHNHTLALLRATDRFIWESECKVCFTNCCIKCWCYSCVGCEYFVHPKCILLTKKKESELVVEVGDMDGSNSIHLPMRDESISLIDLFVKQICLKDNEGEPELKHFSHSHPLIFFSVPGYDNLCQGNEPYILDEENKNKICSGCDRTISASFYGCRPCNFFLHKWCANLPNELKWLFHPHPLILRKEIYEPGKIFICRSCYDHIKGFRFQCVDPECEYAFCLDVRCASLPSYVVHEIHQHPLLLKKDCETEGCVACHRKSFIASFGCATCNFSLHYICALLPHTFRHRYDNHPFILNYGPIKDGPNEYICEFCEDEIDPKWWFYHCIDCDQSVCAKCIVEDGKYFEKSVWPDPLAKESYEVSVAMRKSRPRWFK